MRAVPLEQVIGCSSGAALVRAWQPPVVQPRQLALHSAYRALNDAVIVIGARRRLVFGLRQTE